ncbi:MAG: tRNA (N(6)-L-threonylcarbamoyladenosine(37)-C(2))-methylthiotransferase MtaB [Chloroherpetonaceae bacterium]|nr:tRNA (N(6)-L-threonylcarbamoyladenosine(37)-C(2))-methylthiotransferase MtaB [Chloroherpetonaceae bacterium]
MKSNEFSVVKRIATYTLGCKLNFSETAALAEHFLKQGYELVPFGEKADVTIINTCTVTENADVKCRNIVRRALRASPESFVAVIGCYAQLAPEELASIEGVDVVLGAKEKFDLPRYIREQKNAEAQIFVSNIDTVENFGFGHSIAIGGVQERTRAYLKVQDGCNYNCSYCTIPLARGKSRSESIETILQQAELLLAAGYQEIVLTGVNIGDYGNKPDGSKGTANFLDLLKALEELPIPRLRISSIEPNLLTSEMIDFIAQSKRIVPHFHLPLQSGSAEILRRMRRRYTKELYAERVWEVVKKIPDVCIGADVIVGFPSETDEHFEETYRFIESLPIAYLHVFTFSKRPNTAAAEALDRGELSEVPSTVKQARNRKLQELSYFKKQAFASRYIGRTMPVLFEDGFSDNEELCDTVSNEALYCFGHTANYLRVRVTVPSKAWAMQHLVGKIVPVQLAAIDDALDVVGVVETTPC